MLPHISLAIIEAVQQIEKAYAEPSQIQDVATGFDNLDNIISGLRPGSLNVVAGRSSTVTTCFALNIALQVGLIESQSVAIFSLGQNKAQLAKRMMSAVGEIKVSSLSTGRLEDDDWCRLTRALGGLNDSPIFMDDTPSLSVQELSERVEQLFKQIGGLKLIIIDNFHLATSRADDEVANPPNEPARAGYLLKSLAEKLRIPILVTTQVNSYVKNRADHHSALTDLSGDIANHADMILFMSPDEFYRSSARSNGSVDVHIQKNNHGAIGMVKLNYEEEFSRFKNFSGEVDCMTSHAETDCYA